MYLILAIQFRIAIDSVHSASNKSKEVWDELIRFCRYLTTVHTAPFLCKNPNKNIRFSGSHCSQQWRKNIRLCGLNPLTMLWSRQISVFVSSHYPLGSRKTSVYLNIHFEGCLFKPPSLSFCTKTEVLICAFCTKT